VAAPIHAVEATGVARFMREALWAYPITEAAHIVGLALLFGSIVIVDLRLLGAGRKVPAAALVGYAVPWSLAGFVLAAGSGLMMFTAHASDFLSERVFLLKMALIVVAGVNAALLRIGVARRAWNIDQPFPARVRIAAALSIALWIGVIACGRLLAYF
jgi:uncharacterized protein DUF6644